MSELSSSVEDVPESWAGHGGRGLTSTIVAAEEVTITEESELIGKGNFAVVETLEARADSKKGIIAVGTAGEMKMAAANISVKNPDSHIRSVGRGGLGAVMGSLMYSQTSTTLRSATMISFET